MTFGCTIVVTAILIVSVIVTQPLLRTIEPRIVPPLVIHDVTASVEHGVAPSAGDAMRDFRERIDARTDVMRMLRRKTNR
jgi:hypothetical protein